MASITSLTPERIVEGHVGYVGTLEEVVERIPWHWDFFGEIEPWMQINFGGIGDQAAFRTLELFASRVTPKFVAAP